MLRIQCSKNNNNIPPHMKDAYWKESYSSALGSRTTANPRSDVCDVIQRNCLILNSLTQGHSQSPILVSHNMHSQHSENSNNSEIRLVRYPTPAARVARIQNAIQDQPDHLLLTSNSNTSSSRCSCIFNSTNKW